MKVDLKRGYTRQGNGFFFALSDEDVPADAFMVEVLDARMLVCSFGNFTPNGFAYAVKGCFWVEGNHEIFDAAGNVREFRLLGMVERLPHYVPIYMPPVREEAVQA